MGAAAAFVEDHANTGNVYSALIEPGAFAGGITLTTSGRSHLFCRDGNPGLTFMPSLIWF